MVREATGNKRNITGKFEREEHVKKTSQGHGRCFHPGSAPFNENNSVESTSPLLGGGQRSQGFQ